MISLKGIRPSQFVLRLIGVLSLALATALLALELQSSFVELHSIAYVKSGFGSPSVPYSDAVDPWLHGGLSYYIRGVPLTNLYRPTVGIFFSAIIAVTHSIPAIPIVFAGSLFVFGFFVVSVDHSRILLIAFSWLFVAAFHRQFLDPLNPAALMVDFWGMSFSLGAVWIIDLGNRSDRDPLLPVSLGFFLLGIAVSIRGVQLASGILLILWLLPGWIRQHRYSAAAAAISLLILPVLVDVLIQKRYSVQDNREVTLYSMYTDPAHSWTPASDTRFHAEKPSPAEVHSKYLAFIMSKSGRGVVLDNLTATFDRDGANLGSKGILEFLIVVWVCSTLLMENGPSRRGLRLAATWISIAAIGAAMVGLRLEGKGWLIELLLAALLLHSLASKRSLTLLCVLSYVGAALFHSMLGLPGGVRVMGTYGIFLPAAIIGAIFAPSPDGSLQRPAFRALPFGVIVLAILLGYTGNYIFGMGVRARLRAHFSGVEMAFKVSDSKELDRSLYVRGDLWMFYTKSDGVPFGTLRRYKMASSPAGWANMTIFEPCDVQWIETLDGVY